MTTYPAWTPASRPGIIPLHPLSFGTILGRSFAALRQNPRVLLGFALVRADRRLPGRARRGRRRRVGVVLAPRHAHAGQRRTTTPSWRARSPSPRSRASCWASPPGRCGVIVQGVVVAEVAHAAARREADPRRALAPREARRLAPARLLVPARARDAGPGRRRRRRHLRDRRRSRRPPRSRSSCCSGSARVPLTLWLTVKLLLAPSAIILEHATIGGAIGRSWRLTRGRFWPALGIVVVVSLIFGAIAQVVGLPFQLITTGLTTIIAPDRRPRTDRRHRPHRVAPAGAGRHPADPVGRLRRPVHLDGAHLPRLPHAPRGARPRPALVRGATGCRGHRPPGSLPRAHRPRAGAPPRAPAADGRLRREPPVPAPTRSPQPYPQSPAVVPAATRSRRRYPQYPQPYRGRSGAPRRRPTPPAPPRRGRRRGAARGEAPTQRDPLDRARCGRRPRVAVGVSAASAFRLADAVPPLTPDGDEARRWAQEELSDPVYAAAEPTPLDRVARAIGDSSTSCSRRRSRTAGGRRSPSWPRSWSSS